MASKPAAELLRLFVSSLRIKDYDATRASSSNFNMLKMRRNLPRRPIIADLVTSDAEDGGKVICGYELKSQVGMATVPTCFDYVFPNSA
ncbi:MAG: hypothetical protein ACI8UO_006491 [Verrucomicrobiales bacterium]|jgi:hypothetical protein